MASENTSSKIVIVVVAPLVVGISSGLIVEWLKPGQARSGTDSNRTHSSNIAQGSPSAPHNSTEVAYDKGATAYLGKWYREDSEDFGLEILPNGKLIFKNGTAQTPYDYTVKEDNTLESKKGDVTIQIYFASSDEVIYHSHQLNRILPDITSTMRFKRGEPSHLLRNILIGAGITFFLLCILTRDGK